MISSCSTTARAASVSPRMREEASPEASARATFSNCGSSRSGAHNGEPAAAGRPRLLIARSAVGSGGGVVQAAAKAPAHAQQIPQHVERIAQNADRGPVVVAPHDGHLVHAQAETHREK